MNRRSFIGSVLALSAAPAIVRADSLMRIVRRETAIFLPPSMSPAEARRIAEELLARPYAAVIDPNMELWIKSAKLQPNWDSYGAPSINPDCIYKARRLLAILP